MNIILKKVVAEKLVHSVFISMVYIYTYTHTYICM